MNLPLFLCLPAFIQEVHIVKASISKAIFYTVPHALSATMEQKILQELLFLLVGELIWDPFLIWDRSPSIWVAKEGMVFFLTLICMVKIPHQQIKGFYITIYYGKCFNNQIQWDIGSHITDCISSSPSQGALYSFPQSRIALSFSEALELIAPLL